MKYQSKNSEFYLSPKKISSLINSLNSIRDNLILSLFAYTGIRRNELRNIELNDVYIAERKIIIQHGKGNKQRIIFYPKSIDSLFCNYLKKHNSKYLFPNRNDIPLSLRTINNIVTSVGKRVGCKNPNPRYKNLTPHLFRHSLARNWKKAGGSIETLQKILGHKSIKTTMDLYGTESLNETKENYQLICKHLVY